MDPRARIIKALGAKLARETNKDRLMRICQIVEDVMLRETGLFCNAAFYVAPVLSMLGIHRVLHTPIFALGRVVGYTAHVLEQYENNTLIRPRCKYTGDGNRKFVPIDER
jgi:citrate synthase